MIDVDRDNPPTEIWYTSRDRIRRGLGAIRLTPISWDFRSADALGPGYTMCRAKGSKGSYYMSDCFATEEEALRETVAVVTRERTRVREEFEKLDKALRDVGYASATRLGASRPKQ